ncbi:nucleotidyl transferase AbiEii/AbiGii toxin family protein [Cupriavidus basilensis]|uniref:Nucleotidyl transferase AbiEii/AbiGii toxin family protein n=1 Tax=Cupriavidus basilensis TaxID=68895 RepID=A0ABT6B1M8_9BURK|nr:nucleotidyl transferase AbiEii/AbiGii toxin family protein [Cupriavidus basilensis]MDF3838780.1 nucleotidyl transferase AbiEii/AbiGii toxin family protein [Cupriavidus basilensis]
MPIAHNLLPERPLDAATASLLRALDRTAKDLGIEYFVGGATARIVILEHVFGTAPGRATRDVDIGICVEDWARHAAFKGTLTSTGFFEATPRNPHKLLYRPAPGVVLQLDIIPFGEIEKPAASIAWPPDMDTLMNVAGFREASLAAVSIRIEDDLLIPFASLPSMAILKLLAWRDRNHESRHDATDLLILLSTYDRAGNQDRLYDQESALLEQHGYDTDIAAAALLAKDARPIASTEARAQLIEIFDDEARYQVLIDHMSFGDALRARDDGMDPMRVRQRMDAFRTEFMKI